MQINRLLEMLPAFYRDIKEFRDLTEAQAKQLDIVDETLIKIENDMFILTASEEAIERIEKMFNILADPSVEDLDFRRRRIVSRQSTSAPFTERFLAIQLELLTGGRDRFSIRVNPETFELDITTQIGLKGGIDELWHLLETIVPLNMSIKTKNEIHATGEGTVYLANTTAYSVLQTLTHDFNANYDMDAEARKGGLITGYTTYEIR